MKQFINPHPVVADPGQLGTAKTNRENMHNTTMAVDSILNFSLKPAPPLVTDLSSKEKATNYFADTICEFSEQLTPEELYQALLDAMERHYQHTKKEFDHATKLLDLIK
jgi:7,8-dihydro-6-hydroxymethylpterin-pyrophosphokinase